MKTIPAILLMLFGFITLANSIFLLQKAVKDIDDADDILALFLLSAVSGSLQLIVAYFMI